MVDSITPFRGTVPGALTTAVHNVTVISFVSSDSRLAARRQRLLTVIATGPSQDRYRASMDDLRQRIAQDDPGPVVTLEEFDKEFGPPS